MKIAVGAMVADLQDTAFPAGADWGSLDRFSVAPDAKADFVVDVAWGNLPRAAWRTSGVRRFDMDADGRAARLEMDELTADFDLPGRRVEVHIGGAWPRALVAPLTRASQLFGLVTGKALHLHSSAVERDGWAYVFLGRSEAGKSTAALLSRNAGVGRILREEMTAVGDLTCEVPLSAYALPSLEKNRLPVEPAVVRLRALYWLVQAGEDRVERIGFPQQVRHLCSAASIGIRHRALTVAAIDLAERLARQVPVKELQFRSTSDFWRAIDHDLESGT
jgi:hypothetical protein